MRKDGKVNAKWIDRGGGDDVAVSPAAECVRLLSDPARVSGIKSEGMRSKREAKALVDVGYSRRYPKYSRPLFSSIPPYRVARDSGT